MVGLIFKDLKLCAKMMIFMLIYAAMISYVGISVDKNLVSDVCYILFIVTSVFALTIYTNGFEDRYNTQVMLNSFPINKDSIVLAKYITLIVYIVISCIEVFVFTNIFKAFKVGLGNTADIWNCIIAVCICFIFYSVYYPFYFKLGESIRTFNQILWIGIFVFPSIIANIGKNIENKGVFADVYNRLSSMNLYNIAFIVLASVLLMFYLSFQISKKLYRTREF